MKIKQIRRGLFAFSAAFAFTLGPCKMLAQDATPLQSLQKSTEAPGKVKGMPPGLRVLGPIKFATQADVQYNLGLDYENGQGVTQDYVQAAHWYRKAAEQGDAEAQDRLAYLYDNGLGVPLDYAQAVYWCRKAAEQGDAWAQGNMGGLYYRGEVVPQDYAQAAIWFRKAAEQGDANAQSSLVAVQELMAEAKEKQRERRIRILIAAIGVAFLTGVAFTLFRFRKKLISYGKKLVPRTTSAKQLAVLLPVASWCSACCLYLALDPRLMHHPINAAVTALLFSAPALIVGAVSLWWLSQARRSHPEAPQTSPHLLPDLGKHLAAKGTPQKTLFIYTSWEIDTLQVIGADRYCTTRVQPSEGHLYCATFDFENGILTDLMKAATERTQDFIAEKLIDDPFSVRSMILPDPIKVGITAVLGDLQQGLHDLFIPLVITEVFGFEQVK